MAEQRPYYTIRTRGPAEGTSSSADSTYGSQISDDGPPPATHDTSRVKYHVQHLESFAQSLQDSATRAFPNRGRGSNRYQKVQALLLHWKSDDLFVLPELEDLEKLLHDDYQFDTEIFAIPSENPHLELMLKLASLVKLHEDEDTLFIVYYGGHAKIDESRQSLWCATRNAGSPSLQWSAIQTLLERSKSDVLILLDCCAGAASATFPNGKSITETISASSWDSIAPDPGRYSFTNALIEVMSEWRNRVFSAAMLHTEVLARLKHPRPIQINGKHFEARSTPVHFMMTSNHKAPSIELGRVVPDSVRPPSPPSEPVAEELGGRGPGGDEGCYTQPNEDHPHVMISLALEDNQRLDLNAWEQWLASFPAMAKYVKVQGVFKSHSTLLLLSMPVTVWDMLPDDQACAFVAYIRSSNLAIQQDSSRRVAQEVTETNTEGLRRKNSVDSLMSGTTYTPTDTTSITLAESLDDRVRNLNSLRSFKSPASLRTGVLRSQAGSANDAGRPNTTSGQKYQISQAPLRSSTTPGTTHSLRSLQSTSEPKASISRMPLENRARSAKQDFFDDNAVVPERPPLAEHVTERLEHYFHQDPRPNKGIIEYYASHLGVETIDINYWFHHRRLREQTTSNLQNLKIDDKPAPSQDGPALISSAQLNDLLDISDPGQILCFDLRPLGPYRKSHIHGAANLRVPNKFIRVVNTAMVEQTFADEQSRRLFTNWKRAKSIVFYDRNVDALVDCPTADVVSDLFHREGWLGKCYVLKGPYREFSLSFEHFITSDNMSQQAKDKSGQRRTQVLSPDDVRQRQVRYEEWIETVERDSRSMSHVRDPVRDVESIAAIKEQQKEIEIDFHHRFPELSKKIQELKDDDTFDRQKGKLVGPLATGLDKMRSAASATARAPMVKSRTSPFAGTEVSFTQRTDDKLAELDADVGQSHTGGPQQSLAAVQNQATSLAEGVHTGSAHNPTPSSGSSLRRARTGKDKEKEKTGLWSRLRR